MRVAESDTHSSVTGRKFRASSRCAKKKKVSCAAGQKKKGELRQKKTGELRSMCSSEPHPAEQQKKRHTCEVRMGRFCAIGRSLCIWKELVHRKQNKKNASHTKKKLEHTKKIIGRSLCVRNELVQRIKKKKIDMRCVCPSFRCVMRCILMHIGV